MPEYSIELARARDIPALPAIELAAAQLLAGYAPASILAESTDLQTLGVAQAAGRLWAALADDIPVGFALVEMLSDNHAHLAEIDVHPLHGRRGLGTRLMRAACEWAARSGCAELTLTTYRAIPWNMPFYARLGFVELPRTEQTLELMAIVQDEAARGLAPELRVAMRYQETRS